MKQRTKERHKGRESSNDSEQPDSLPSHLMDVFSQPSISPHIEHRELQTSPAIDAETGFDLGTG